LIAEYFKIDPDMLWNFLFLEEEKNNGR